MPRLAPILSEQERSHRDIALVIPKFGIPYACSLVDQGEMGIEPIAIGQLRVMECLGLLRRRMQFEFRRNHLFHTAILSRCACDVKNDLSVRLPPLPPTGDAFPSVPSKGMRFQAI